MATKFAVSAKVENKKAQHLPFCQRTPRRDIIGAWREPSTPACIARWLPQPCLAPVRRSPLAKRKQAPASGAHARDFADSGD
jgi:hypothetical protein